MKYIDITDLFRWGQVTVPQALLSKLLPGPVTVIFNRTSDLNPELNPATSLVGIRIPDHQFIREVARGCQEPLALTSANISSAQSTLRVEVSYINLRYCYGNSHCVASPPDIGTS